jgi:hypothetical protein
MMIGETVVGGTFRQWYWHLEMHSSENDLEFREGDHSTVITFSGFARMCASFPIIRLSGSNWSGFPRSRTSLGPDMTSLAGVLERGVREGVVMSNRFPVAVFFCCLSEICTDIDIVKNTLYVVHVVQWYFILYICTLEVMLLVRTVDDALFIRIWVITTVIFIRKDLGDFRQFPQFLSAPASGIW